MPHAKKRRNGKTPPKPVASKLARKESQGHGIQKRPQDLSLPERMEAVLIEGDLKPLTVPERMQYYRKVCSSLGLNPLTRPFDYLSFNNKIILYARKDCTDQLRRIHGVSVTKSTRTLEGELTVVEVEVRDRSGRTDTGIGAWATQGLKGEAAVNGLLKAETKAKRRATLSICGLGMLDSSELDTIEYDEVSSTGRVVEIDGGSQVRSLAENAREEGGQLYELAVLMAQDECRRNPDVSFKDSKLRHEQELRKQSPAQFGVLLKKFEAQKVSPDLQPADRTAAAVTASGGGDAPTAAATYKVGEKVQMPSGKVWVVTDDGSTYDGLMITTLQTGGYFIEGPDGVKKSCRELIKQFYMPHGNPPGLYVLDGPEKDNPAHKKIGKLMAALENAKIKFRMA